MLVFDFSVRLVEKSTHHWSTCTSLLDARLGRPYPEIALQFVSANVVLMSLVVDVIVGTTSTPAAPVELTPAMDAAQKRAAEIAKKLQSKVNSATAAVVYWPSPLATSHPYTCRLNRISVLVCVNAGQRCRCRWSCSTSHCHGECHSECSASSHARQSSRRHIKVSFQLDLDLVLRHQTSNSMSKIILF